nr:hypothetical protein [Betaproteobacteria bacterium]
MNICHGKHQSKRRGFAFCAFAFRHALVTLCLLQTLISAQLAGAQVRGEKGLRPPVLEGDKEP